MSNAAFNELSDAEAERLAILAEESAEVIQIVGKILRHGYTSTHPDNQDGPNNMEMLEAELGHVEAIKQLMFRAGDINAYPIRDNARKKLKKLDIYLHHNSTKP